MSRLSEFDATRLGACARVLTNDEGDLTAGRQFGLSMQPNDIPVNVVETVMALAARNYYRTFDAAGFMLFELVVSYDLNKYGHDVFVSFLYNSEGHAAHWATTKNALLRAMNDGSWSINSEEHYNEWSCYMD